MADMQPNDGEQQPNSKSFNSARKTMFQVKIYIAAQSPHAMKRTKLLIWECFCAL